MDFNFVTWSIWAVGFAIWVIWVYFSIEEFKSIVKTVRKEMSSNETPSEQG
jgi:hypothetical protein